MTSSNSQDALLDRLIDYIDQDNFIEVKRIINNNPDLDLSSRDNAVMSEAIIINNNSILKYLIESHKVDVHIDNDILVRKAVDDKNKAIIEVLSTEYPDTFLYTMNKSVLDLLTDTRLEPFVDHIVKTLPTVLITPVPADFDDQYYYKIPNRQLILSKPDMLNRDLNYSYNYDLTLDTKSKPHIFNNLLFRGHCLFLIPWNEYEYKTPYTLYPECRDLIVNTITMKRDIINIIDNDKANITATKVIVINYYMSYRNNILEHMDKNILDDLKLWTEEFEEYEQHLKLMNPDTIDNNLESYGTNPTSPQYGVNPEKIIFEGIKEGQLEPIPRAKCQDDIDIATGDKLTDVTNIITLLIPKPDGTYSTLCFSYSSWFKLVQAETEKNVFVWELDPARPNYIGHPLKYAPVYKLGYSWVQTSRNLLLRYNTFLLHPIGIHPIGSMFGVSNLHGAPEALYKAIPVHRKDFKINDKISEFTGDYSFAPIDEDFIHGPLYNDYPPQPDCVTLLSKGGFFSETNRLTGKYYYLFPEHDDDVVIINEASINEN